MKNKLFFISFVFLSALLDSCTPPPGQGAGGGGAMVSSLILLLIIGLIILVVVKAIKKSKINRNKNSRSAPGVKKR